MANDFVRPMGVQPPDDRPIRKANEPWVMPLVAAYLHAVDRLGGMDHYGPTEHGIARCDGGEYVKLADVLRLLEEG